MDYDFIETPENVVLERPLAGIGSRFIAGMVDTLLLAGLMALLAIVLMLLLPVAAVFPAEVVQALGWVAVAYILLLMFALYWGYFVACELLMNGQSPGKRVMKIRVVRQEGGAVQVGDVIVRNLLRVVDAQFGYVVAGVCMFVTRRCQRLGDLAAGTVVVCEQTRDYSARTDRRVKAQWEATVSAEALRATGLTPEEYRVLTNYQARRSQLTLEARARVLPRLLVPVLQRLNRPQDDESLEGLEEELDRLLEDALAARRESRPEEASR